jgi:hypothetical protein
MKNLLIYTGPHKKFDPEHLILARIQIDNSLDLGWKKEDLLIITDFPFSYNGVKSLVVKNGLYYDFDKNANKAKVLAYLSNQNLLDSQELYWCHDFDAYQQHVIKRDELDLADCDLGLTHYTYKPEWQFGSLFFRQPAADIFDLLDKTICAKPHSSRNNEKTLTQLINEKAISESRFKRLNVTYNIMVRYITTIYRQASKPLKVLHFHPWYKDILMSDTALNVFMYGKNRLKMPLMTDRLIKIFHYHGIK